MMLCTPYNTESMKLDGGEFSPLASTIEDAINILDMPVIVNSKFWALVGEDDKRWLIFDEEAKHRGNNLELEIG